MGVTHLLPLLGSDFSATEEGSIFSKFKVNLGEVYNGPFEALLNKIDEGQFTLMDLSLTEVTSAFLEYLNSEKNISINAAAEFLFIASYLIELKAKSLLPTTKEEEDEIEAVEEDLIARLEQYKAFKEVAEGLRRKREHFKHFHAREHLSGEVKRPVKLVDIGVKDLVSAFSRVWQELEKRGEVREIATEAVTIEDKIREICNLLVSHPQGFNFKALFNLAEGFSYGEERKFSYLEVIVTFLAMLELAKRRIIRIVQGDVFGEIKIIGVIN